MKRALFPILTVGLLMLATGCRQSPRLETRTFALHHMNSGEAANLINPYVFTDRQGDPGKMSATSSAVTVRETPDNLDRIARVLKEYDKPRPDVRLRFQLIEADDFKGSDPRIAPVEKALRKIFQFHGYRLAGQTYVEATDRSEVQQRFLGSKVPYELKMSVEWLSSDVIRLHRVILVAQRHGLLLQTTVNVRPGQTLVLGSSPKTEGAGALLLVVTADSIPS